MFKEEYHLALRFQNCDETLAFTINTKTAIIRYWNSKAIQLMVTYQDRAPSKYLDLSHYALGYTLDVTKELISDILECAETLPIRPVYMPPHFKRDEWIASTLTSMLSSTHPVECLIRRLNDLPVRVVVCAANRIAGDKKHAGLIIPANRHHSPTMNALYTALGLKGGHDDQGFIDQWGQFMDRKEALTVVMSSGQPFDVERNGCGNPPNELYSEGIC